MTAQPRHVPTPEPPPRVPRTIDGIADALPGTRRMEFYRAVSQAQASPDLQHVIATWWGQAMLDTDPRDQIITAVRTGTLPTTTMAEVLRRRRAHGAAMPGE